jgi:transposase
MGGDGAADAGAVETRPVAPLDAARHLERDLLCAARRHRLAAAADRHAAQEHGVRAGISRWRDDGLFARLNHALVMMDRERVGREASPTAAALDSQSVKITESGGPCGYDAGKKVKGRKRQAMVDTDGRGLVLEPQPADVQDRAGAGPVLRLSRRSFPFVQRAFADSGYAGDRPATATIIVVEIVRKPPDQVGFAVHPRRWVVEHFFAWISRNRRLWKDPEATLASARAFLYAASVMILVRRLARS